MRSLFIISIVCLSISSLASPEKFRENVIKRTLSVTSAELAKNRFADSKADLEYLASINPDIFKVKYQMSYNKNSNRFEFKIAGKLRATFAVSDDEKEFIVNGFKLELETKDSLRKRVEYISNILKLRPVTWFSLFLNSAFADELDDQAAAISLGINFALKDYSGFLSDGLNRFASGVGATDTPNAKESLGLASIFARSKSYDDKVVSIEHSCNNLKRANVGEGECFFHTIKIKRRDPALDEEYRVVGHATAAGQCSKLGIRSANYIGQNIIDLDVYDSIDDQGAKPMANMTAKADVVAKNKVEDIAGLGNRKKQIAYALQKCCSLDENKSCLDISRELIAKKIQRAGYGSSLNKALPANSGGRQNQ